MANGAVKQAHAMRNFKLRLGMLAFCFLFNVGFRRLRPVKTVLV